MGFNIICDSFLFFLFLSLYIMGNEGMGSGMGGFVFFGGLHWPIELRA